MGNTPAFSSICFNNSDGWYIDIQESGSMPPPPPPLPFPPLPQRKAAASCSLLTEFQAFTYPTHLLSFVYQSDGSKFHFLGLAADLHLPLNRYTCMKTRKVLRRWLNARTHRTAQTLRFNDLYIILFFYSAFAHRLPHGVCTHHRMVAYDLLFSWIYRFLRFLFSHDFSNPLPLRWIDLIRSLPTCRLPACCHLNERRTQNRHELWICCAFCV